MATATGESPPICSLANRYRELSLLQIKYENLIDVCSALLRPWLVQPVNVYHIT